jgi:hypothetical protein
MISLTIIRIFVPADPQEVGGWLSENKKSRNWQYVIIDL